LQQHQYSYTYYSNESIIFNRAYYPDNIYKEHSPKDKEGLCLEINWFKNISSLTDEEIIQKALEDVEQLGIFQKQNPSMGWITKSSLQATTALSNDILTCTVLEEAAGIFSACHPLQ